MTQGTNRSLRGGSPFLPGATLCLYLWGPFHQPHLYTLLSLRGYGLVWDTDVWSRPLSAAEGHPLVADSLRLSTETSCQQGQYAFFQGSWVAPPCVVQLGVGGTITRIYHPDMEYEGSIAVYNLLISAPVDI